MKVVEIWRDDKHGSTSLVVVGGQKAYARIWDGRQHLEWSWFMHDEARQVWTDPERLEHADD